MEFWRYDRWDNYVGPVTGITSAIHCQEAGGENSLTIETSGHEIAKGDRIVWEDGGIWHEHIANEPSATRDEDGKITYSTYCEDALNEVFRDKVDEKRIRGGTSSAALSAVLQQTRWTQGTVNVTGNRTKSFYHCSVGECLQKIAETWAGEIYSSFDADENGITRRYVNFVSAMGSRSTHKRFEYRKDLLTVKRSVSADDVYTAMRGYGKGESVGEDEWGRRTTFSDINGGKDYVEDATALATWGRPDGSGGMAHSFGTVIFEDCEDAAELMALTQQHLDATKEQKVSYECSVLDLKGMGFDYEGVSVGDTVHVIDSAFTPTLRLEARVMAMKRNLLDVDDVELTIGNIRKNIGGELAAQADKINALQRRSASWDVAAATPDSYLEQIVAGLNAQFDAGGSYQYSAPEQGTIWSSVPLDTGFKPTTTPASAIQLKGGGFRIADSVNSDGAFDWRSFGTGAGFTADEITAGTIRGGSNTWNLNTGDLHFAQGSITGTGGSWNLSTGVFTETDASGNTVRIDPTNGFSVKNRNGEMIAGTIMEGDSARFFARSVGVDDMYITTDYTDGNTSYAGLVMMRGGVNRFNVAPWASGGKPASIAMSSMKKNFLTVIPPGSNKAPGVVLCAPVWESVTYIEDAPRTNQASISICNNGYKIEMYGNIYMNDRLVSSP